MVTYLKQKTVVRRNYANAPDVVDTVARVIAEIRATGDVAVSAYSEKFDSWMPASFRLSNEDIERCVAQVPEEALADIATVQSRVRRFAEAQLASLTEFELEMSPGVFLGQRNIPVANVAAYVPGGRFPLVASAHMTIVTAKVAGVPRVVAATPPIRGEVPAATVAAMHMAGADEIYLFGGVQAIAALALGTETIAKVDLVVGPGNPYVAEAKRQLFGEVGIDLLAGPTEILVIADEYADPFTVAVDLLSQAEHGPDSPAVLITTSSSLAEKVVGHIKRILPGMPTRDNAAKSWADYGEIALVASLEEAWTLADEYASEHVEVLTQEPREALEKMQNYGALFLGAGTCVSYGDKVIGTNHVLPTRGAARYTGGLWVGKYLKTVTYQEVTNESESEALGELCGRAARVELMEGHARSGDLRAAKFDPSRLSWAPPEGSVLR
jgi:sulfopropanediol 3-dehydrogenase